MAYHPKDHRSDNPRIQCPCCGKWMRLYKRSRIEGQPDEQLFFGGCAYTNGDHYPINGDHNRCEKCCHQHCKPKAIAEGKYPKELA